MILIIHQRRKLIINVTRNNEKIKFSGETLTEVFWYCAEKFPSELIGWCDEDLIKYLNLQKWQYVFHHDLIMASYSVKSMFLPHSIGYIDQFPFVNVNREVLYGTWQMSADVGGIMGKVLLAFKNILGSVDSFEILINSVSKLGQQNGLFCYSVPNLLFKAPSNPKATASSTEIFNFVQTHYKTVRLFFLLFFFIRYERSFPLQVFLKAVFKPKLFNKNIDLSGIEISSSKQLPKDHKIDVIIPTLGRSKYLLQVLEDLKHQTLLPKKIVVVEQIPDPLAKTQIEEISTWNWPFQICHILINQTGACNARNIALEHVDADWIFFADDDNRMENDILEKCFDQIKKYGLEEITLNYRQKGEKVIFDKVKQWATFGAGNSIVSAHYASKIKFDMAYEHGYAEDKDYGMQLRNMGCDIVYHPDLNILHLKAPIGGFREAILKPWEKDEPKPSPTLMVYAKKFYTNEQVKGFRDELYLRYYFKQKIINPWKYYKMMEKRWEKSLEWADILIQKSENQS